MEALGDKDTQLAQLVDASNAVFAVFAKQEQNVESPAAPAARRPGQDPERAWASSPPPPTCSARRCTSCKPFARALGPAQEATARLVDEDHARSSRTRSGRSRAKSCPSSSRSSPPPRAGRSVPEARRAASRCSTNSSTSSPSIRAPKQAGFLFFLDWDNHDLNSVLSYRRGARGARSQPDLPQLQRGADPQRRGGNQPDGQPARRPAEPAR